MGFRILFQNILAFVDKEAAQVIFSPQENDDALPGHTDCAKIYGSGFNLEANSICFKMDTSLAVDSSSRYEIIDFRPWVVCHRMSIIMFSSDFGPGCGGSGRPFGATDDSEDRRCLMVHVCEHKYRCLQRQPSMLLAESCSQFMCHI